MKRRPRTIRRMFIVILLLLCGGAMVNVAVAWGFAIRPLPSNNVSAYGGNLKSWVRHRLMEVSSLNDLGFHAPSHLFNDDIGRLRAVWREERGAGVIRSEVFLPSLRWRPVLCVLRTGWPLHNMSAEFWSRPNVDNLPLAQLDAGYELRFGFDSGLPIDRSLIGPQRRVLPYRIAWPGFAINTIFYAGVLWMMFVIPGTIRRRRRLKRGLCPNCAYLIGTSPVCTECGKAVSARSVEPA
jgi:hypothetical protein